MESASGYGGSSAREKSEMPGNASCGGAVRHRYTTIKPLTVPGFDRRTFDSVKKMMARFGLELENRWMGLTFRPKNRNQNVPAFNILLSAMNLGQRTFRKSRSKNEKINKMAVTF